MSLPTEVRVKPGRVQGPERLLAAHPPQGAGGRPADLGVGVSGQGFAHCPGRLVAADPSQALDRPSSNPLVLVIERRGERRQGRPAGKLTDAVTDILLLL